MPSGHRVGELLPLDLLASLGIRTFPGIHLAQMPLPGPPLDPAPSSSWPAPTLDGRKVDRRMTEKMAEIEERTLARLMVPDARSVLRRRTLRRPRNRSHQAPDVGGAGRRRCLQRYAEVRTPISRQMFSETQAWISDRTARGPFAFEAICEALGIDPIGFATAYVNGVCNYPAG
jgi:hypothetical protein